jgi:hypothetical protein
VLFLYHDQLELLASLVGAANAIQGSDDNCARHLELFVALDVRPKGLSYPINLLRNIGSVAAATRRVVSLDADFVPSVNAAVDLALLPDTVGREDSPPHVCFRFSNTLMVINCRLLRTKKSYWP